jgi:pyruvate dehydrogenase E2 component (dihydrolipoamide acetyltransferase)
MAITVIMPQMGYDMHEGRLVKWLKHEGDNISRGEDIAEIETDKAVIPVPATEGGVLRQVRVEEGTTVPVGHVIAIIGGAEEEIPDDLGEQPPEAASATGKDDTQEKPDPPTGSTPQRGGRDTVRSSPLARRLAQEHGIDISKVTGTGPHGRITEKDVLASTESPASPKARETAVTDTDVVHLSRMRQAIARLTTRSKQEIPHFYVTGEIDMGAAMALRSQINSSLQTQDIRVSVNDIIVKACALALTQPRFSAFNSSFRGDKLEIHPQINIGIAIDLEDRGLIIPALLGCENLSLIDVARNSKALMERAKADDLQADEYSATTFTVSNLGMFDVHSFIAIIYPPNSAVLALGQVRERPTVKNGQVVVGQTMFATLSTDHRVSDGAAAARFLGEIKRLLESPAGLLIQQ